MLLSYTLLASCSTRPAFHDTATDARVVSVERFDGGASGPVPITVPVPVGGALLPIELSARKGDSRWNLYTLRTATGEILQSQSSDEFYVGACVRLWHARRSAVAVPSPEYRFVAGTLEYSDAPCD